MNKNNLRVRLKAPGNYELFLHYEIFGISTCIKLKKCYNEQMWIT